MTKTEAYLADYLLQLGDSALILGHRLSEWCGHGPILEQDIALTNIALDLIGEARNYLQLAGQMLEKTEDELAFLRDVFQYKNLLITEQPNQDFAFTMARQFYFDVYHFYLCKCLSHSPNEQLAAVARKSLKEVTYHLKFSAEWIIRLGDGTELSHQKMQDAIQETWTFTGEMLSYSDAEAHLVEVGIIPDLSHIASLWHEKVGEVLAQATLKKPVEAFFQYGGKIGKHTEYLGYILAEMQFLQRAYPNSNW